MSFLRNLSNNLVFIFTSVTDVDSPFSVDDAATAAEPRPITALAHPDKQREISKRKIALNLKIKIYLS